MCVFTCCTAFSALPFDCGLLTPVNVRMYPLAFIHLLMASEVNSPPLSEWTWETSNPSDLSLRIMSMTAWRTTPPAFEGKGVTSLKILISKSSG